MFRKSRIVWVSIVAALVVASLGAGGVMAAKILNPVGEDMMISGAYQKNNGMLRLVNGEEDVRKSEVFIQWNQKGEKGDTGADGIQGLTGEKGDKGDPGSLGADGATGAKGDQGDTGPAGADGPEGPPGALMLRCYAVDLPQHTWLPGTVFEGVVEVQPGWQVVSGGYSITAVPAGSLMVTGSMPWPLSGAPTAWRCEFTGRSVGVGQILMYAVMTPLQEE